jgi:putative metalloenzyme radical SAM/SPASM domain maturase
MKKNSHPKKIYVELTTRCNLHCKMCVKNMDGSCIPEEDMPLAVFDHLLPALTYADNLILNGIGEPLLYPNLLKIIRSARLRLPAAASIGFQSNGVLLNKEFSQELIEAGLNTICLSVDDMRGSTSKNKHSNGEHSFCAVQKAVLCLARARIKADSNFKIGLEIVLSQENVKELPALVNWAADNHVDYIITTHLIQYDSTTESVGLFNPNSSDAVQLFNKYNQRASSQGIDIATSQALYQKSAGTQSSDFELRFFEDMRQEARDKDIRLNLQGLVTQSKQKIDDIENLFQQARSIATTRGIDLFLPPLQASNQRSCVFMTDESTFIASNGDVMSCHFLWHTYSCQVLNETININKRVFGNISQQSLWEIWQDKEYTLFRKEAEQYDYSPCWNCSQGPCSTMVNGDNNYASDCFGSLVPCGHCQWNLGGFRCL